MSNIYINQLENEIAVLKAKLVLAKEALELYAVNPHSGATAREALENLK